MKESLSGTHHICKTNHTFALSNGVWAYIKSYADEQNLSYSAALSDLVLIAREKNISDSRRGVCW